jgi:dipeptidyl aminopeptidase/acylaminoacyl peptidase
MNLFKTRIVPILAALFALALLAASAQARPHAGPSRIVFVAGKQRHCVQEACHNLDLVRATSPHGGRTHVLAGVREVAEMAAADDGTVAVLSRNHAGGGANAGAFTQVYLIHPNGKRTAVFSHRLQRFNATGLSISADGRLLALSGRYTEGHPEPSRIWIVRADGTGMHAITDGPGGDEMPSISPDGRTVAFSRTLNDGTKAGRKGELFTAPIAGGAPVTRLTENEVDDVNPVWSPDGSSIAFGEFVTKDGLHGSVQTIRPDGSGQRRIASTGAEFPDPDYSPSGRSLVFVGQVPGAKVWEEALYTVRANGSGRKLLSARFEDPGLPQWTVRP